MLSPASSAAPESEQHGNGNDCVCEHEGAGAAVYIVPFQGELPRGEHSTYSFDASSTEIGVFERDQSSLGALNDSFRVENRSLIGHDPTFEF